MLSIIWDVRGYFFWMLVVSAFCFGLECWRPWRRDQAKLRPQLAQDLFWLVFNAHFAGLLIAVLAQRLFAWAAPAAEQAARLNLLAGLPLWLQFLVFFVARDFFEWGVHNLLHRVPLLWHFHKVHHSIETMDWLGNFRFHWLEIVVYKSLTWLPLTVFGVDPRVLLGIAVLTTLIGHLNHSNLDISWGWGRYLVNSSRMHIWHHMYALPEGRSGGVNFAISLSLWDWIFATSYWPSISDSPEQQPARLGFPGINGYPRSLLGRLLVPFSLINWR